MTELLILICICYPLIYQYQCFHGLAFSIHFNIIINQNWKNLFLFSFKWLYISYVCCSHMTHIKDNTLTSRFSYVCPVLINATPIKCKANLISFFFSSQKLHNYVVHRNYTFLFGNIICLSIIITMLFFYASYQC